MTDNGYYPPYREIYSFAKTPKEKAKLRKIRNKYSFKGCSGYIPIDPTIGSLKLYRKNDGRVIMIKSCRQGDIFQIINFWCSSRDNLLKYEWCGKTYTPDEKPYSRYEN